MVAKYMDKTIAEATSEELLHALIKTNGLAPGPRKTTYCLPVSEALIAIGDDRTASVHIFNEDIEALNRHVE